MRAKLKISKWLSGVVVLLLAPSLLFASLWIKNTLNEVHAVEHGLFGLEKIQHLSPLVRQRVLQDSIANAPQKSPFSDDNNFTENERVRLDDSYRAFLSRENRSAAIADARAIVRTISQSVKLTSVTGDQTVELPYLVSDTLLTLIIEASTMIQSGERLAKRDVVNLWDKMSVPVQGGQFKVAADSIARTTRIHFPYLDQDKSETLNSLAARYWHANAIYQRAGAQLLMSTSRATSGSEIVIEPARNALPPLLTATLDLWEGTINHLIVDLKERREAALLSVKIAGAIGLLVILAAFGLAVLLSRSLAEKTEQEFQKLGFHDPLTGLPNRRALMKTIETLAIASDSGITGLVHVDVRQFKAINNRYGDQIGDAALRSIAEQLEKISGARDLVARIGGTEFVLLRRQVNNVTDLWDIANAITASLGTERNVDGFLLRHDCSVGISISQNGSAASEQLITDAALAVRAAKQKGSLGVCIFEPEMRTSLEKNSMIAEDLLDALKKGDIVPWYQPQVCATSGALIGAEALVRWVDLENGVRFPGSFLPAATEAGYMDAIDAAVRSQAMLLASDLLQQCPKNFHIGLNMSASLLADPNCVDLLLNDLKQTGLSPSHVSIEILEAVMIDEFAAAPIRANISQLSDHGFFIELDDFGTGHSSISSLRDLKIDRVKIDRSFVSGVDSNPDLQKFTSALIQLARSLDISVLAEGVETDAERVWLAENGCEAIQGFLISKAIPGEDLLARAWDWSQSNITWPLKKMTG